MDILPGQMVFWVQHRGAVSHQIKSVLLELTVAITAEDAEAHRGESFLLAIPQEHAQKVISSIQASLERFRQTN